MAENNLARCEFEVLGLSSCRDQLFFTQLRDGLRYPFIIDVLHLFTEGQDHGYEDECVVDKVQVNTAFCPQRGDPADQSTGLLKRLERTGQLIERGAVAAPLFFWRSQLCL